MAKKATTLHDNLGNELLPVTNASITYMDDGNTVQAEIQDLKEKTQYNKGHYTTEQDLLTAYPNNIENPQSRKGWYAIIGETDSVWIWDIEGNEWKDSGVSSGGVESVNGLDGEVVLTGGNINATATINDTSKTELINKHLTDIYSELDNKVDLDSPQIITGAKTFQTNTDYDLQPAELIKLNNNFQNNTRELNIGTVFNEELELISKYKDSGTNPIYRASLNLGEKGLFFTEYKEGEIPESLDGIIAKDGKVYSVGIVDGAMSQDELSKVKNTVDLNSSQTITGTKVFTEVIGLANTSEGTVDQIKHINNNFLITSGTGQNLLNVDEGLETISAFNRELAYKDEIAEIQGNYVTNDTLTQELQTITDMIPTKVSELTNDSNYATEQYVQENGGKIDTISVNGAPQTITNKNVNISVPTNNSQLINSENYQNKSEVETLINDSVKNCFKYGMTTSPNADDTGFTFLTTLKDKNGNEAGIFALTAMDKPEEEGYSTNGVGLNLVTSNGNFSYLNIIDSPSNQGINLMSDGTIGKSNKSGDFYSINLPDNNGTLALVEDLDTKQDTLNTSQLQAVNSGATSTNINQITTNSNNINTINSKIPAQASSTNQLADKDFVNSSLNSITAFYITSNADGDPFATKSALTSATTYYSGGQVATPTRNDYAIVLQDETKDNATTRYIYYNQWEYQYTVNETALTAEQLSAINSGITSTLVGKISSNEQMLNSLSEQVATDYVPNTRTINNKPLSSNITLNASDVGALPSTTVIPDISGLATQSALNTTNTNVSNLNTRVTTNETNIAKKLDKVTYEYNKELAIGSTGKVLVGKFPMYDSNLTIEVSSTTSDTYNGTLVIATQNINDSHGGNYKANVYGDPTGTLSSAFVVKYPTNSRVFEVYCNFPSWSKNLIHIKAVALSSAPSNIVELVTTVPTDSLVTVNNVLKNTFLTGITSSQVTNALGYTPYNSTNPNGYVTSNGSVASATKATQDGSGNNIVNTYATKSELGNKANSSEVVKLTGRQEISGIKNFTGGTIGLSSTSLGNTSSWRMEVNSQAETPYLNIASPYYEDDIVGVDNPSFKIYKNGKVTINDEEIALKTDIPEGGGGDSYTTILDLTGLDIAVSASDTNGVRYNLADYYTENILNSLYTANKIKFSITIQDTYIMHGDIARQSLGKRTVVTGFGGTTGINVPYFITLECQSFLSTSFYINVFNYKLSSYTLKAIKIECA